MGCDIHGFIEYKRWENLENPYSVFSGRVGTRDYVMFGLLAGVRRDGCIFEPRGIPEDIGWSVKSEFCLYVNDELADNDGYTSKAKAKSWVNSKFSKWANDEHTQVTHPDWHTPSWLSVEEFEQVLIERKSKQWEVEPEWNAILAAMKVLPGARFVFWFDN